MSIDCGLESYKPGQFVMLKSPSSGVFLRRPFGIMELKDGILALLYKIRGQGTLSMSTLTEEDTVSIEAPLGNGFNLNYEGQVVYVAGGAGLPPLISLHSHLKKGNFLFGVKTESEIPFDYIPGKTTIATEDGTYGFKGFVTDVLKEIKIEKPLTIYACGPAQMLKQVSDIAKNIGAKCQVSYEERMACGFGVCSGCVVKTVSGNKSVCVNGPVFNAEEILWR